MDEADQLHADLFPALDRLVAAGWAQGWSCTSGSIDVRWNPDHGGGLGGEAAFLGFVKLLAQLCPGKFLSENEQAMLTILELSLYEQRAAQADDVG